MHFFVFAVYLVEIPAVLSPGSERTLVLFISIELVHRAVDALCDNGADGVDGIANRLPH